jgi:hypothetical protein
MFCATNKCNNILLTIFVVFEARKNVMLCSRMCVRSSVYVCVGVCQREKKETMREIARERIKDIRHRKNDIHRKRKSNRHRQREYVCVFVCVCV